MAQLTSVQTNFTAGELSPRLLGRTDIGKYFNGAQTVQNLIPQVHGGLRRRPGTRYVADAKNANRKARLIRFEFNIEQAYVVEFGHMYVRFFRDDGQVLDPSSPGDAYEIASPYDEGDLFELQFTQSADVLFIVHPDYQPRELQRLGDADWQFVEFDNQDGPYLAENTTDTTLTAGATTGSGITVTASDDLFASTDVGRLLTIADDNGDRGWAEIVTFNSATSVDVDIIEDFADTSAHTTWRLGAWSDTTGYPVCVHFHQNRLWFAGSKNNPQTLWSSRTFDFNRFSPNDPTNSTQRDDDGIIYALSDGRVNAIRWMKSDAKGMVLGTQGGEFVLQSRGPFDPITPSTVAINRMTGYGSPEIPQAHRVGPSVLFITRAGRTLREFVFNFQQDQFLAPDLTLLADHILDSRVVSSAYAQEPDAVLWVVTLDGGLYGMTYEREQDVVAWHRHVIGGTDAVVESVAVIPEDDYDRVWLSVKREVDGASVRHIEYIETKFGDDAAQEDAFFVDSGLTYDGSETTTISGLDHLEGETVAVLADGGVEANKTVSSGSITLDKAASKVQVGLPTEAKMLTMPIFTDRAPFEMRGKYVAHYKVLAQLHRSALGFSIGGGDDDDSPDEIVESRNAAENMDEAPSLFTGMLSIDRNSGHSRSLEIEITVAQPVPFNLLSLIAELDVGGA